ncbi:MAG: carbohydrate kinase family protein [Planctomycetes bacterium]|nr:carbohydrate kinase family protein [Planctomycetota bacterium]
MPENSREQPDCVVAGHICVDMTPLLAAQAGSIEDIFRPGKLVHVGPATISTGGPVSNTGLPLRRLGAKVKFMGKCGSDMFGAALIEALKAEAPGAQEGMKISPGETTSYTVVVNVPGVDRIFLHCPGANDTFCADDVDLEIVSRARLFHFGYPPLMARMYAGGPGELVKLYSSVKSCRRSGPAVTTSMDMAYPDPASPAGRADWSAILKAVLPLVDVFTPSAEELLFMLQPEKFRELRKSAGRGDLLELIDGRMLGELGGMCLEFGAGVVMIKCGKLGIYCRTARADRIAAMGACAPAAGAGWTGRELFQPSYHAPRIVSATGAGDCAIAGFLRGLLAGCQLEDCLKYACSVGEQNLSAADSVSGVKNWDYTTAQIRSNPPANDLAIPMPNWRHDRSTGQHLGPNDGKN